MIKRLRLFAAIFVIAFCVSITCQSQSADGGRSKWRLVWADEFNYEGLPDAAKWNYDIGGHGWGNKELQYYTDRRKENARVENGNLVIEARRDSWEGHEYTSARLVSKGKGDWTYGRFEVKAKLPTGRGTWPAIWMLPTSKDYGGWPSGGEIDIMGTRRLRSGCGPCFGAHEGVSSLHQHAKVVEDRCENCAH